MNALSMLLPLTKRDWVSSAIVFLAYYIVAEIGLYIYYTFQTSPALIWPPVGIALAAVIIFGYRMWLPIFLGQSLAVILQMPGSYQIALIIAAAYTLQALGGLYVLHYFGFERHLDKLRNTLILVSVAFFVTLIEPTIATVAQQYLYSLSVSPWLNLGRAWGAGIFSVLVFTPFIITWFLQKIPATSRKELTEALIALIVLTVNNVFLFWTPYTQNFGIAIVFFLPTVLLWFALRLHVRWMTLAIVLTSIVGIAGTIIAHPTPGPLHLLLLTDEIYIGLVAAIFLVFTAVVEERRAAYVRLATAYEATAASDKAKGDFIAILSHELRNPLAPIVSSLELLKLQPQTKESIEVIQNAQDHAEMIRRLLDDLLDTARLTQKKLNLKRRLVRLQEVVDQSVATVRDSIEESQHTLSVTIADDMELNVDPIRLKQIIINLLSNACKYTARGGKIELICDKHDSSVRIRVIDNGIGIPAHVIPQLFEPFRQFETDSKHSVGLGIGLYLAKRLVEMHGGRVQVESEGAGSGSTFTVYIPLNGKKYSPKKELPQGRVFEAARILIVDDNEHAALALKKLLRHHGHRTEAAYSGEHALHTMDSFDPDVILMDIGMPEMDGYETARRIRSKGWDGKIVALTGYGQASDRIQSKRAGFNHHLVKPVGVDTIVKVLGETSAP
jgi:signal transduction histidine kinase/CheY-like chemotaxis protein